MTLTIRVELLRGVYEAATADEVAEWPPHPARLFCALLASAEADNDRAALTWLEEQPPPVVLAASEWSAGGDRATYTPTNQLVLKKASSYQHFPARKALGPKTWRRVVPAHPVVAFEWSTRPDPDHLDALRDLAGRVGYLGRSTSPVVADVNESSPQDEALRMWVPDTSAPTSLGGSTLLTVPRPGYLADLTELYETEDQPWLASRHAVPYRAASESTTERTAVIGSPYRDGDLIILPFANRRIGSGFTMAVTAALRNALESHLDGGPVVLRGRRRGEAGPRHQVACLGLPFVGQYGSGELLGVAVALPGDIDPDDRRRMFVALSRTKRLTMGRLGVVDLTHDASDRSTLRRETWAGPAKEWVSATPISCDRHHRKVSPGVLVSEVHRACAHLDLPGPEAVEVSSVPLIEGAQSIRPNLRVRHAGDRATPSFHARVTFPVDVEGPIVLGNLRHYGLGLMRPIGRGAS